MNATLSTSELYSAVQYLEADKAEVLTRLAPLRKGDMKPVSAEEKAAAERLHAFWMRKSASRKKIASELWSLATAEMPEGKSKDELWVGHLYSDSFSY